MNGNFHSDTDVNNWSDINFEYIHIFNKIFSYFIIQESGL